MRINLAASIENSFTFVDRQHPFYPHIRSFKSLSLSHPDFLAKRIHTEGETGFQSYIKAHFVPDQGWKFKRLYFSIQSRNPLEPLFGFSAQTFFYSGDANRIESYEFPQDPFLTSIGRWVDSSRSLRNGQGPGWDVLSYTPGRHLAFLRYAPDEAPVFGKFLRRSDAEEAYGKLCRVFAAVKRSRCIFSVPAPIRIDPDNGLFFQEARPGRDLAVLLNKENFVGLLYSVGQIHRDLHQLDVADVPEWDFDAFLQHITTVIRWISFFRPEQGAFLAEVRDLLLKGVPAVDPRHYTFCHGDYGCPQILYENGNSSVVDFDDCIRADPNMEIGRLMAFLKKNVPLFRGWFRDEAPGAIDQIERACESYLNGYEERAGQPLDRKRILWYRICYEIHYLARLFRRDRFEPVTFGRAIKLLRSLSERLLCLSPVFFLIAAYPRCVLWSERSTLLWRRR